MIFPVDQETMKNYACQMPISFLYMQRDLEKDNGIFIGPGSEKKWYSISEDTPQGEWDRMAEKMLVELAESGCPIFRATSPLSRGRLKSKGHVFTKQSQKCSKSTRPFATDRGNPLSEGNQVPHSC